MVNPLSPTGELVGVSALAPSTNAEGERALGENQPGLVSEPDNRGCPGLNVDATTTAAPVQGAPTARALWLRLPEPKVLGSLAAQGGRDRVRDGMIATLPPSAAAAGRRIYALLTADPEPPDLARQVANEMEKLSVADGAAVGLALDGIGLFLPSLAPAAPVTEDGSTRIHYMQLSYRDCTGAQPRTAYMADILYAAAREGFRLVLWLDEGDVAADVKARLCDVMKARGYGAVAAEAVEQHLRLVTVKRASDELGPWGQDSRWATSGDDVANKVELRHLPEFSDSLECSLQVFNQTAPSVAFHGAHAVDWPDESMRPYVQGRASRDREFAEDIGAAINRPVVVTRTYNEGGNMLVGTRPNGEPYAVIGNDGLIASRLLLKEEKAPELATARVQERMQKMTQARAFDETLLCAIEKTLVAKEELRGEPGPVAAKRFLAELDIVKDLLAADLAISRDNLCFVPQPDYHIDMFMHPLAPGVVMLQDYDACVALIDTALAKADELLNDPAIDAKTKETALWQRAELQSARQQAVTMGSLMAPVMKEITKAMTKSGLKVVAGPLVMKSQMRNSKPRHVNFANAVAGTGEGRSAYYITNGTSLTLLRDAFADFIRKQGVAAVYYAAGEGGGPDSLNDAEHLLDEGGINCRENHHGGLRAQSGPTPPPNGSQSLLT
jgi:hypothetical protein